MKGLKKGSVGTETSYSRTQISNTATAKLPGSPLDTEPVSATSESHKLSFFGLPVDVFREHPQTKVTK
jgi:hypothetical protein